MDKSTKAVFCGGTEGEIADDFAASAPSFDRAANAIPGEVSTKSQAFGGEVSTKSSGFGGEASTKSSGFGGGSISAPGLNANVIRKPMKKMTAQTGAGGDDDPVGLIQRPEEVVGQKKAEMREVMIKAHQFPEQVQMEMGTQYDPPGEDDDDEDDGMITNVISHPTILTSQTKYESKEDTYADKMLRKMEQEMTKGRIGGAGPQINGLDDMMAQLSQISTDMVKGRKELLSEGKQQKQEEQKQGEIDSSTTKQNDQKAKQSVGDKRKKLREEKRSKQKKERNQEYIEGSGRAKTQQEINESKENRQFETYYRGLQIMGTHEWEQFMNKLKEPLDVCFRINSIDRNMDRTEKFLKTYLQEMSTNPDLVDKIPKPVAWYPNGLAYSFDNVGRVEMRKAPAFKKFHQFLVEETENGRIFRQEKVSMIPVTLLNIKPTHKCLDMCAAPGSKTIQMLEYLHQKRDNKLKKGGGFVIANDTDVKRAYMLTHQARRMNSPSLFVTNNDARQFPNLRIDEHKNSLKFDRILCDVPCSGDGTLRKNLGLWKNFHCHMGHGNHPLQLSILERGFKMLKKGGRITYSTCTFNPIENEAVVAAAVHRHMKQVKILDVSKEVSPNLKYRPGLTRWQVYHRGKGKREEPKWFQRYRDVPDSRKKVIKETMFTDVYTELNNEPERVNDPSRQIDPLGLRNCMRFYPQDDNQGGFFVAVLEKIYDEDDGIIYDDDYSMDAWSNPKVRQKEIIDDLNDFVNELEQAIKQQEAETGEKDDGADIAAMRAMIDDTVKERQQERDEAQGSLEDQIRDKKQQEEQQNFPFAKLIEDKPDLWETLREFYGITDKFPKENLAYQKDTSRNIVLLGDGLNNLMGYSRKNKLNVVNLGLKIFTRNKGGQGTKVGFRILQEGVEALLPYLTSKRVIKAKPELYHAFVEEGDHQINFETLRNKWETNAFEMEIGSAIMCFDEFAVTVWIGKNNVSLMLGKEEMKSMQFLMANPAQ